MATLKGGNRVGEKMRRMWKKRRGNEEDNGEGGGQERGGIEEARTVKKRVKRKLKRA